MNLKLKRIAPLQAGKILGVFYALISLLMVPFILFFMALGSLASRNHPDSAPFPLMFGMGIGFMVFLPVLYGVFGFIFGAVSAWIYNLLAKWLGGFELEFEQSAPPPMT